MADVLQPNQSSRDNIATFIGQIEDEQIRTLLTAQLENILTLGRLDNAAPAAQASRAAFFQAINELIQTQLVAGGVDEN